MTISLSKFIRVMILIIVFASQANAKVVCFNLRHTGYEIVGMLGDNIYEIAYPYNRYTHTDGRAILKAKTVFTSSGYFSVDMWVNGDSKRPNRLAKMQLKNGFTKDVPLFEEAPECAKVTKVTEKKAPAVKTKKVDRGINPGSGSLFDSPDYAE